MINVLWVRHQVVALFRGCVNDGGEGDLRRRVDEARAREVDVRQELVDVGPETESHTFSLCSIFNWIRTHDFKIIGQLFYQRATVSDQQFIYFCNFLSPHASGTIRTHGLKD